MPIKKNYYLYSLLDIPREHRSIYLTNIVQYIFRLVHFWRELGQRLVRFLHIILLSQLQFYVIVFHFFFYSMRVVPTEMNPIFHFNFFLTTDCKFK